MRVTNSWYSAENDVKMTEKSAWNLNWNLHFVCSVTQPILIGNQCTVQNLCMKHFLYFSLRKSIQSCGLRGFCSVHWLLRLSSKGVNVKEARLPFSLVLPFAHLCLLTFMSIRVDKKSIIFFNSHLRYLHLFQHTKCFCCKSAVP